MGYKDWQRYAQWFDAPLVAASNLAIGAGSHTDGPLNTGNWSSVILYAKATGGSLTATIRQTSAGLDGALTFDTVKSVAAGTVLTEAVVLLGNEVTLILQGSTVGETVTYGLIPANTNVNAATIGGSTVLNIAPTLLASWPPASPANGDLQVLELPSSYDPVGGKLLRWLCQYDGTNAMWDVLVGSPLYAEVQTAESRNNAAYGDLATIGPASTPPRNGDYIVAHGCAAVNVGGNVGFVSYTGAGLGAAADADAVSFPAIVTTPASIARDREKAALTTVSALTLKYRTDGAGTVQFSNRWVELRPVRIS